MTRATSLLFALFALAMSACAPMHPLMKRAAFDLTCPQDDLQVVDLDSQTMGVTGCGGRATYVWVCNDYQCAWVQDAATIAPMGVSARLASGRIAGRPVP